MPYSDPRETKHPAVLFSTEVILPPELIQLAEGQEKRRVSISEAFCQGMVTKGDNTEYAYTFTTFLSINTRRAKTGSKEVNRRYWAHRTCLGGTTLSLIPGTHANLIFTISIGGGY